MEDGPGSRAEKRRQSDRWGTRRICFVFVIVLICMRMLQTMLSESVLVLRGVTGGKPKAEAAKPLGAGVLAALHLLRSSHKKYIIVDAKNGLGNRLRALASAMSVAEVLNRPLLLVWMSDLHCNCSFRSLFASPLQFAVLEEELPRANMSEAEFQIYNYMRPEEGAVKDALIEPDPTRHLYFKSGFMMNHPFGTWHTAQSHIQRLVPVPAVADKLVSDKGMVGLHVRNVFDAPRDATTTKVTLGKDAMREAQKEYGTQGTRMLMRWRKASHWTNFVPRIVSLLQEHGYRHPQGLEQQPLHFYLAADSQDAYGSLSKRFPSRMLFTPRGCASERCDFRDCTGMQYSLIDMMNLARTRLILGSGWSSYSEVAAYWGGEEGRPIPMLMAGRDFGLLVDGHSSASSRPRPQVFREDFEQDILDDNKAAGETAVMRNWPKPFC